MTEHDRDERGLSPSLAGTIHDAANALTVVLGWLERAKQAEVDPQDALARAASHARWSRDQLRRLLGANEPPSMPSLRLTSSRASAVLTRTAEDLAFEASRAGVTLRFDLSPDAGATTVRAATELWQVLTNLLLNAVAMSPPSGTITLSLAAAPDGRVRFGVEDEGPGIPESRRRTLFEAGHSTRASGAGVGLRGSFGLAQGLGGELRLVASPQRGARFELDWPTDESERHFEASADRVTANELEGRTGRKPLSNLRILILEDDDAVLELLDLGLTARGANVVTVSTAAAFESALAEGGFDVALFDLSPLGDANAVESEAAIDRIVALAGSHLPRVTLLAISGSGQPRSHPEVPWLRKPFSTEELASAIQTVHSR